MRDVESPPPRRVSSNFSAIGVAAMVSVVCIVLAMITTYDPMLEALLDYRRQALAAGSLHRLVTAHFVHLSMSHALLDVSGLVLVAWIFAIELTARRMMIVTLAAVASIDASLWFLHPAVERYAGLSGVLHGWFAAGAVGWAFADRRADAFAAKRAWGIVLLGGLVGKLVLEQRGQSFWLDDDSLQVVTSAHRWGAAAGALAAGVDVVLRRRGARAGVAS